MKSILFNPLPLLLILLIIAIKSLFYLRKKSYAVLRRFILFSLLFLSCYFIYYFIDSFDMIVMSISCEVIIPISAVIFSMIIGIYLLRKHYYVVILPWVMSVSVLLSALLLIGVIFINTEIEFHTILQDILFDGYQSMMFYLVASICILFCFIFSDLTALYFYYKKDDLQLYIRYKKSNLRLYISITLLPIVVLLFLWLQFSSINMLDNKNEIFYYLSLEVVCAAMSIGTKYIMSSKNKARYYIYVIVNLCMALNLIINEENIAMYWLLSYNLLCFIGGAAIVSKRSTESNVTRKSESTRNGVLNQICTYIPLFFIIGSCKIIVALGV